MTSEEEEDQFASPVTKATSRSDGAAEYPFDLGKFHYPLGVHGNTTDSKKNLHVCEAAQLWFDRGLIWCFGYNHNESAACFEKAISYDSQCLMAHWGLAYVSGPNYNKPWEAFLPEELPKLIHRAFCAVHHEAVKIAQRLLDAERKGALTLTTQQNAEIALAFAQTKRYQKSSIGEIDSNSTQQLQQWNIDYADAMEKVVAEFPNDITVLTFAAEALMNLTPWQLWDLKTGKYANGARTEKIIAWLEHAWEMTLQQLKQQKNGATDIVSPGLLHLYIHAWEMSPTPEKALRAADLLRDLCPHVGHLCHMPSHIDVLCGHYWEALVSNTRAVEADRIYLKIEGPINFYTLYRCHDYHFRIYAALFLGQYQVALSTANEIVETVPDTLLRVEVPPMADWLESFIPMKYHVFVRFGKWRELTLEPFPEDKELYCYTTAVLHYTKGIAYASLEDVHSAKVQQELFEEARKRVPESRTLFNNKCVDILAVASSMLEGELKYRMKDYDVAFTALKKAIALEDGLPYDEPWGWMQPVRHALGALSLEQGRVDIATQAYREDLGLEGDLSKITRPSHHMDNVWALHGYVECLKRLGKLEEARIFEQRLQLAKARADVPVMASCACRLGAFHK